MDILDLHKRTDIRPAAGKLLIAEPFLTDPSFSRSVVLLCEHGAEGTVGFVINRPSHHHVGDLLPGQAYPQLPVYEGGPVQNDTLHMIHRMPELVGGVEIMPGIYWGGSYQELERLGNDTPALQDRIRLLIGYSGWEEGQLERELEEGAWLVADSGDELIFGADPSRIWQAAIRSLGSAYAYLANMPVHPQLN